MRNLSALVSSFQTPDGDRVGLEEFRLSRISIDRERQKDRQMISLKAKPEFLENLPDHLALHWDGSMMEDLLGIKNEVEAILASGGQGKYKEGKLYWMLSSSKMPTEKTPPQVKLKQINIT